MHLHDETEDNRIATIINEFSQLKQLDSPWQSKKLFLNRLIAENLLVLLLQYIGLMFSTLIVYPSMLWLASGTAIGFAFLRGYSILPGIWLGSVLAYYSVGAGTTLASIAATIFTLQTLFLLWFNYRLIGPSLIFFQVKPFVRFILLSSILTAITSFMLVSLFYSPTLYLFLQQWLANFNGILIISIAIITWDYYFPQINQLNTFRLILPYGLLLTLTLILLFCKKIAFIGFVLLSIASLVMFIAQRFGWCGAVAANFLFGFILCIAIYLGIPLFNPVEIFLCLQAITALYIAIRTTVL